eukprot:TRINITY_DN93_c0_g3_i1.p1 TRINITY_DN93_c0_g3~~TRINITY_DN93_c0_g3_i1.p1  ORF type:complete len:723 (+),score=211.25 TRINITY_DN93_c0_g3_i1:398-2566(+)
MLKKGDLYGLDLVPGGVSSIMADAVPPDRSNSSSAPPALQLASDSLFAFRVEYAQIFSDIRTHEDYLNFYESYSGPAQQKLPPPLETFPFNSYGGTTPNFFDNYYGQQSGPSNQQNQRFEDQNTFNRSNNVSIPQWSNNIAAPTARRGPPGLNYAPDSYPENSSLGRSFNELGNSYSNSPTAMTAVNTANFIWKEDEEQQNQNYSQRAQYRPQNEGFNGQGNYNQGHYNQHGQNLNQQQGGHYYNPHNQPHQGHDSRYSNTPRDPEEELLDNLAEEQEERDENDGKTLCRYYANGFCSRGDKCFYSHDIPRDQMREQKGTPQKAENGNKSNRGKKEKTTNQTRESPNRGGKNQGSQPTTPNKGKAPESSHSVSEKDLAINSDGEYTSFEAVIGKIYSISKDQQGCRFLQKKLEEKDPQVIQTIYEEVREYVGELMIDPFGNYLCQKLLEFCNPDQRLGIIESVSDELVTISKNMHGTRAVQKLVECLTLPSQIKHVENALKNDVVSLIQDLNGNHVIQRCLNLLQPEDNQFIYDAVINNHNCIQVATHRHGCCVLQRCVDFASPKQKKELINVITKNALVLVQDPFGNYVVQYVLKLYPDLAEPLAKNFTGNLRQLATQKFSSNVIEKCLQVENAAARAVIIEEVLTDSTGLSIMLQDPFANYVIQTALTVSDPKQHAALVDAIKPHLSSLGNTPYGKRIQSKIMKDGSGEKPSGGRRNPHH